MVQCSHLVNRAARQKHHQQLLMPAGRKPLQDDCLKSAGFYRVLQKGTPLGIVHSSISWLKTTV